MTRHKPVLLEEVVRYLSPESPRIYVDATIGAGGHAERILEESSPEGRLIGIDIDPYMISIAKKRLERFKNRSILIEDNFVNLKEILCRLSITSIDGIIFDLGVAGEHLMLPERGFSILRDGPLDMRLSPYTKLTAEYVVNEWGAEELIDIFQRYGEERRAKKIVRYIISERKKRRITTTTELAKIVEAAIPYVRKMSKVPGYRIHPATKIFQALRIVVNNELENIKEVLPVAVDSLSTGGRLCAISFHSLEERLIKDTFRLLTNPCICPPKLPRCVCGRKPKIKMVTRRPIVPAEGEIRRNPRARSGKLRVVERL